MSKMFYHDFAFLLAANPFIHCRWNQCLQHATIKTCRDWLLNCYSCCVSYIGKSLSVCVAVCQGFGISFWVLQLQSGAGKSKCFGKPWCLMRFLFSRGTFKPSKPKSISCRLMFCPRSLSHFLFASGVSCFFFLSYINNHRLGVGS